MAAGSSTRDAPSRQPSSLQSEWAPSFRDSFSILHPDHFSLGYELPLNCNPADFYLKTLADKEGKENAGAVLRAKYEHETDGLYSGSWLLARSYSGDYLKHVQNL